MSFIVRKFNFLLLRIRYQGFRLWQHNVRFIENLLESLMRRWLLKGELLHAFLNDSQPYLHSEKQALIDNGKTRKVIYFTFRTLHFLDWFAPIHLALERLFPDKYEVFTSTSVQLCIGLGQVLSIFAITERWKNVCYCWGFLLYDIFLTKS